jgi:hypothetical protein
MKPSSLWTIYRTCPDWNLEIKKAGTNGKNVVTQRIFNIANIGAYRKAFRFAGGIVIWKITGAVTHIHFQTTNFFRRNLCSEN